MCKHGSHFKYLQHSSVLLRRTDKTRSLLLQVGLNSKLIHSQFNLVPGGSLQLVRRCESKTCQGHCVCAAEDLKCTADGTLSCVDMSEGKYHYLIHQK